MVGVARIELATPAMSRPATHANLGFLGVLSVEKLDLPHQNAIRQSFEYEL